MQEMQERVPEVGKEGVPEVGKEGVPEVGKEVWKEGVPEVGKEGVPEVGKEGVPEVGKEVWKEGVREVGKGGAGLHLPPDVLDLLFGALELPLLLHQPARPAPHQPNCHVPPANSDDALVSK